ncbi:MAG: hypothetical protein ACRDSG_07905 [Pseudonocardiaceae bacterium]
MDQSRLLTIGVESRLGPGEIEVDLRAAAAQTIRQRHWVEVGGGAERLARVAQLRSDRRPMDPDVGRPERRPCMIGVLADQPSQTVGGIQPRREALSGWGRASMVEPRCCTSQLYGPIRVRKQKRSPLGS